MGLGSDVVGGYDPSMWSACCAAVLASHSLEHQCIFLAMKHKQQQQQNDATPQAQPQRPINDNDENENATDTTTLAVGPLLFDY